jgi:hypothetical protein
MLLNPFRLVNRIRFDFKTLLAETETDSEIFLPNLPLTPIFAPEGFNAFLSTRVYHSYLNFTERGNRTYVHSFLKINTFFQRLYTGRMHLDSIQYIHIQPEGAGQPAVSHGTQRTAPKAPQNPDLRSSNYFSCSVQIVTVQSNDKIGRAHV